MKRASMCTLLRLASRTSFPLHAAKPVAIKNDAETNKASDDLLESILAGGDDPPPRASR